MRNEVRLTFALFILTVAAVFAVAAQDQPTIMKDWVQMTAFTVNHQKGNYDIWTWLPKMSFRVNGPIESGGQLYVEVGYPGSPKWVTFDCDTGQIQKGYWWKTSCGGRDNIKEELASTYTGPVTFAIKMRNELAGTDTTLFTGKAKVLKARSNEHGPKFANHHVYWIDHDWNLPIGYVWYTPHSVHGWKLTTLNVAFWVRGEGVKMDPHIFYQGKEVGKVFLDGIQVGAPGCNTEIENNTTHTVEDAALGKSKWVKLVCSFHNVYGHDQTGETSTLTGPKFEMEKNPGEYEFKLLRNNKLARSIKFTVKPGGSIDNGIATSNKLGNDRVIVPVTIIGDQDGLWDKTAWKTDAFYGNPLTGFSVSP
ncbi:MAG TPA: hypothetical protein VFZ23_01205 [Pyrinomonadaceae bacterium]